MSDIDPAMALGFHVPLLKLLGIPGPGESKVVLDISPDAPSRADVLAELGWTHVALDPRSVPRSARREPVLDPAFTDSSRANATCWPDAEQVMDEANRLLDGRAVAVVLLIDILEYTSEPSALAQGLGALARRHPGSRAIVRVATVSTMETAFDLLLGEWRPPSGSDATPPRHLYTAQRLQDTMTAAGWQECDREDVSRERDDGGALVPSLASKTPLYGLLAAVRERAGLGSDDVTHLVRAYAPVPHRLADSRQEPTTREAAGTGNPPPFLSVLLRTQGRRPQTLQETLLSLFAQTSQNFEVVLACHRVPPEPMGVVRRLLESYPEPFQRRIRVLEVHEGGRSRPLNAAVAHARGAYVAILDDDDLAFGDWVESFEEAARTAGGQVLRAVVAEQVTSPADWDGEDGYEPRGKPRLAWPAAFDLMDHLVENQTPPSGYAFPRAAFHQLGLAFDENLPVLEDWDLAMQAALLCGVHSISSVTSLYRAWLGGENSLTVHPEREWRAARATVHARLDARPWPLPAGSVSDLVEMRQKTGPRYVAASLSSAGGEVPVLRHALAVREQELLALRTSTSWRLTRPFRFASRVARRLLAAQAAIQKRAERKQG